MWIKFNKNGVLQEYISYGNDARVGSTDFQIFAVFGDTSDEVDLTHFSNATIRFQRPDIQGSEYPNLFMQLKPNQVFDASEAHSESDYFVNGHQYTGFLFDFNNFVANNDESITLLDTPGMWLATITLLGANSELNVTGMISFNVQGAVSMADDEAQVVDVAIIVSNIAQLLASNIKKGDTYYEKICEGFIAKAVGGTLEKSIYTQGSIVYDPDDGNIYKILTVTDNPNDSTGTKVFATYSLLASNKAVELDDNATSGTITDANLVSKIVNNDNCIVKYGNTYLYKLVQTSGNIQFRSVRTETSSDGVVTERQSVVLFTKAGNNLLWNYTENTSQHYNKAESDELLNAKVNTSDLNFVDLSSVTLPSNTSDSELNTKCTVGMNLVKFANDYAFVKKIYNGYWNQLIIYGTKQVFIKPNIDTTNLNDYTVEEKDWIDGSGITASSTIQDLINLCNGKGISFVDFKGITLTIDSQSVYLGRAIVICEPLYSAYWSVRIILNNKSIYWSSTTTSISSGTVGNMTYKSNAGFYNMQTTGNKVTSISTASTDTEYPSAKAVYDFVSNNFSLISETGNKITLEINSTTYELIAKLYDKNNNLISTSNVIDLPLESIVTSATYYATYTYGGTTYNKVIVITLATTDVPTIIPVADLVAGLQAEITAQNKLSSDLVSDSGNANKFVTEAILTWLSNIMPLIVKDGNELNLMDGLGNDIYLSELVPLIENIRTINVPLLSSTTVGDIVNALESQVEANTTYSYLVKFSGGDFAFVTFVNRSNQQLHTHSGSITIYTHTGYYTKTSTLNLGALYDDTLDDLTHKLYVTNDELSTTVARLEKDLKDVIDVPYRLYGDLWDIDIADLLTYVANAKGITFADNHEYGFLVKDEDEIISYLYCYTDSTSSIVEINSVGIKTSTNYYKKIETSDETIIQRFTGVDLTAFTKIEFSGLTEISTQDVRITDLDSGIYKLSYAGVGGKKIYYNGTSGTEFYGSGGTGDRMLQVTKIGSLWTWIMFDINGLLVTGSTTSSTGSYNAYSLGAFQTKSNKTNSIDLDNPSNDKYPSEKAVADIIDTAVSTTSKNAVQNKAITLYVDGSGWKLSLNPTTYVLSLLDKNNNVLSSIDLPLESIVTAAQYYATYTYDGTTYQKVLVITLATTSIPVIVPIGELISGLQNEITSQSPLSSDLVNDTGHVNKFVTQALLDWMNNLKNKVYYVSADGVIEFYDGTNGFDSEQIANNLKYFRNSSLNYNDSLSLETLFDSLGITMSGTSSYQFLIHFANGPYALVVFSQTVSGSLHRGGCTIYPLNSPDYRYINGNNVASAISGKTVGDMNVQEYATKNYVDSAIEPLIEELKETSTTETNITDTVSYKISGASDGLALPSSSQEELLEVKGNSRVCSNLLNPDDFYQDASDHLDMTNGIYLNVGTYTLTLTNNVWAGITSSNGTATITSGYSNQKTIEVTVAGTFKIQLSASGISPANLKTNYQPMLNTGSTPLPYEPYFEGIKNSNGKLIATGRNLLDISKCINDGWSFIAPFNLDYGSYILSADLSTPLVYVYLLDDSDNVLYTIWQSDYSNNLKTNPRVITIDTTYDLSSVKKIRFGLNMQLSDLNHNFMLNYGSTALPYEDFTQHEITLPELKSAGSVSDTIKAGKKIIKVKSICLNDYSPSNFTGNSIIFSLDSVFNGIMSRGTNETGYIISNNYQDVKWSALDNNTFVEGCMTYASNTGQFRIYGTSISDIKPNTIINFALATPIETDYTEPLYLTVYNNGSEQQTSEVPYTITRNYDISIKDQVLTNVQVDAEQQKQIEAIKKALGYELLWENGLPDSGYSGDVQVSNLWQYKEIAFDWLEHTVGQDPVPAVRREVVRIDEFGGQPDSFEFHLGFTDTNASTSYRLVSKKIEIVTAYNEIDFFSTNVYDIGTGDVDSDNTYIVPYRIWGKK